jgi:hypothetical protein
MWLALAAAGAGILYIDERRANTRAASIIGRSFVRCSFAFFLIPSENN